MFYDSALAERADSGDRWRLWQRLYGFAAVPPTAFGQELARRLLDSAWARYATALPTIRRGVAALGISPDSVLRDLRRLLGCGDTVRVRLTVFVGGFEGNAFAFGWQDGMANIAVPIEAGDPARSLTHEMSHALHRGGCAHFTSGYGQTLGELVVTEGLAMRTVEQALPGHDANYYTAAAPGWFDQARARRVAILRGIREHLADSGAATVQRFTFGEGTTGLRREAYYAGWEIVGAMMGKLGMSLHEIARTAPDQYPDVVGRAIEAILASAGHHDRSH